MNGFANLALELEYAMLQKAIRKSVRADKFRILEHKAEKADEAARWGCHGIQLYNKILGDADFADYISLQKSCKHKLQQYLNKVRDAAESFCLKINANKTKNIANTGSSLDLLCDNQTIEQVLEFTHLGSTIHNSGPIQGEVSLKISQANASFRKLS